MTPAFCHNQRNFEKTEPAGNLRVYRWNASPNLIPIAAMYFNKKQQKWEEITKNSGFYDDSR